MHFAWRTKTLLINSLTIRICVLHVKGILATRHKILCQCFLSGVNCVYYVLKSSIFVKVDVLWRKKCLLRSPAYPRLRFYDAIIDYYWDIL